MSKYVTGIDEFVLTSHDEMYAPPEQNVLRVSLVDDVLFFTIAKSEDTFHTTTYTRESGIGVDLIPFLEGVSASINARDKKKNV